MTLITQISGIPNFMLIIFGFMLGSFQKFYSDFQVYEAFYSRE